MVEHVFVIGFHHKDLSSEERGEILRQETNSSIHIDQNHISKYDVKAVTLLKTCNRIELYGYGNLEGAKDLFSSMMSVDESILSQKFIKLGVEAVHHIFKVASGLDSQVLGDQEIMSQFKRSFKESKTNKVLNGFMERLANSSLQAAKLVRKETDLTGGTTSLSYAAIQILKEKKIAQDASILVLGLGKFGKSILQNIKEYFPNNSLTICNRTSSKSYSIANEIEADVLLYENITSRISEYDILICSIEVQDYLLHQSNYSECNSQIIIDLSVPSPIHPLVKKLDNIKYFSFDDAADIVNNTKQNRLSSIEPANEIVKEFTNQFIEWSKSKAHVEAIKEWKYKVSVAADVCPFFQHLNDSEKNYYLNRSIGHFANFVKKEKSTSEDINLIHQYLKPQS